MLGALVEAQERGFLGPGPVVAHVTHARRLLGVLPETGVGVDLGSGGGVPGLVLAASRPGVCWTLVESQLRRSTWLREAIAWLQLANVLVVSDRAELAARGELRASADVVTARSFGPPGVTAECGAPLLRVGATLWVSEPPVPDPTRWPMDGLMRLGLRPTAESPPSWAGFICESPCSDRFPRRVGIPSKRPLF